MTSRTDDVYFVLRAGSTREEEWTWDEITHRCRSGEFTGETRIYLYDENRWAPLDETDLGPVLEEATLQELSRSAMARDEDTPASDEALEQEYAEICERLDPQTSSVEPWIGAGCLAFELGLTEEARDHFQKALDLHPFHPRVVQEVKRLFTPAQRRGFQRLERPAAPWDDLLAVAAYPLAQGPLYALIPAAVFAALLFVPRGGMVVAELVLLWCYRCMRAVAAGRPEPVPYARALEDPIRQIVVPGATLAAVLAEWSVLFWGLARLGMWIDGKADMGFLAYVAASPVLTVAFTLCALAWLPAVMSRLDVTPRAVLFALNPVAVTRAALAMKAEYALTLLLLFALALGAGVPAVLAGSIPVAGELVWAVAATFVMFASAFILGRLRTRTAHLFED